MSIFLFYSGATPEEKSSSSDITLLEDFVRSFDMSSAESRGYILLKPIYYLDLNHKLLPEFLQILYFN
jgi:hypothetical protein